MNKLILFVGILLVLVGGFFAFNAYVYQEEQADSVASERDAYLEQSKDQSNEQDLESVPEIKVTTPTAQQSVSSPIQIQGEAQGSWFFEATAPVVVVDWDGRIIGESYIEAQGEWMTERLVPFEGTLSYDLPADSYSRSGTVILRKANPSGLPQNDFAIEIPVTL